MSILYKNARNVRFVLFRKNSGERVVRYCFCFVSPSFQFLVTGKENSRLWTERFLICFTVRFSFLWISANTETTSWESRKDSECRIPEFYSFCGCGFNIPYAAVTILPVASVQCIAQTTNIASGIILFYLFLDEKPNVFTLIAALLCIGGIILVTQPNFIFRDQVFTRKGGNLSETTNMTLDGSIYMNVTSTPEVTQAGFLTLVYFRSPWVWCSHKTSFS